MQDRFSLLSYDQDELRSTTGADLDAVLAGVVNSSSRAQEFGPDYVFYLLVRTIAARSMDIHRANVVEKTNRIIHILKILSFVFLPITFISSVYGMNFAYMPELTGRHSYFITLGLMLLIVIVLVGYMKWKKWI